MADNRVREAVSIELGSLDRAFAAFVCRLAGGGSRALWLAAALASRATADGSVCLDLQVVAGEAAEAAARTAAIPASLPGGSEAGPEAKGAGQLAFDWSTAEKGEPWQDAGEWGEELRHFGVVGAPGETAPLVLDQSSRLYLNRYWRYEKDLADRLRERAATMHPDLDPAGLCRGLDLLFPPQGQDNGPDWQRVAAWLAVTRSLTVIAGGPGTGKTTTVVKVLALLSEMAGERPLRIALAAPTGKAAGRLKEAVSQARERLCLATETAARIPAEASTIHRLLGAVPGSVSFRHHGGNPLPFDVVVVDEASMVDLPLMAKLLDALAPECRLVLLGDRDQLASVEAGAVLGDICHPAFLERFSPAAAASAASAGITLPAATVAVPPLCDAVVTLKTSHRFAAASGIGSLSRLVNDGDGEAALELMRAGRHGDIGWRDLPPPAGLAAALKERLTDGYRDYLAATDPAACLERFSAFRLLSPFRQGPYGVAALNSLAERSLGLAGRHGAGSPWYPHRPLLVTRNDHQLRLFNGDIGVIAAGPAGEGVAAWFPASDGGVRNISPLRLPPHETVFAMTVHKSQGSEFDTLLLLLPPGAPELLTRELVYTAITRAKRRVEIWGDPEAFVAAVSRRVSRSSGLRERLWRE